MRGNPGKIVAWRDIITGEAKQGIAYNKDQQKPLLDRGLLLVTRIDENYKTIFKDGKPLTVVKSVKKLTVIGMAD